jgi:hypothetical protein
MDVTPGRGADLGLVGRGGTGADPCTANVLVGVAVTTLLVVLVASTITAIIRVPSTRKIAA